MRNIFKMVVVLGLVVLFSGDSTYAETREIIIYGRVAIPRGEYVVDTDYFLPLSEVQVRVYDSDPTCPIWDCPKESKVLGETTTDILGNYSLKILVDTDLIKGVSVLTEADPPRMTYCDKKWVAIFDSSTVYKVNFPGELLVGAADILTISGRVVYPNMKPVGNAIVTLYKLDKNAKNPKYIWATKSMDDGSFRINVNWDKIGEVDGLIIKNQASIRLEAYKKEPSGKVYLGITNSVIKSEFNNYSRSTIVNNDEYVILIPTKVKY